MQANEKTVLELKLNTQKRVRQEGRTMKPEKGKITSKQTTTTNTTYLDVWMTGLNGWTKISTAVFYAILPYQMPETLVLFGFITITTHSLRSSIKNATPVL